MVCVVGAPRVGFFGAVMIRVAVFDSSPVFEVGFREIIRRSAGLQVVDPAPVGSVSTDVCVIDASLMELDALRLCIQRAARVAPVLLTVQAETDRTLVDACLEAGAVDVIDRRAPADVLLRSIRSVAGGTSSPAERSGPDTAFADLSQREREVLHQIAKGMTHAQIAAQMDISRNTVDTYVKRIRAKLGVGNKAELTRVAILSTQRTLGQFVPADRLIS
ncbi:UvrY/SirA/GacA family response regulator transcription factor [Kibdelosporangium lantanae]